MTVVDRLDELQASLVGRTEYSSTRQRTGARHIQSALPRATGCVMVVSQGSGVCTWSCCHLANGNKTCPRLFTHVISFLIISMYDAWISRICRPKFTKRSTRVEQLSVLNKFFSELQYSAAFGCESRKFAGGVWKYAKFRHFLAHLVV